MEKNFCNSQNSPHAPNSLPRGIFAAIFKSNPKLIKLFPLNFPFHYRKFHLVFGARVADESFAGRRTIIQSQDYDNAKKIENFHDR